MTREEARQEIRNRWRNIILPYTGGIAKQRVNGETSYICPFCGHGKSGDGLAINPKSKDGNGLKCFGCSWSGDILDLIQQEEGTNYNTALSLAARDLGITIDDHTPKTERRYTTPKSGPKTANNDEVDKQTTEDENGRKRAEKELGTAETEPATDYTAYYKSIAENLQDARAQKYLQSRGISEDLAKRYWIGFDPAWKSPTSIRNGKKTIETPRIIIPTGKGCYIARNIQPNIEPQYRYRNEGSPGLFNAKALENYSNHVIFVTEGAFDALSVIAAGETAIALNSTSNTALFLKALEGDAACIRKNIGFILYLDNDSSGKQATEKLREGLDRLKMDYLVANICGAYKDANEAFIKDPEGFRDAIQAAVWEFVNEGERKRQEQNEEEPTAAAAEPEPEPLPGLLTYSDAVNILETADDRYLELKSFPAFSATAKIKLHDSVVIAADTGAGKSSLAINFLNDLNADYPCIYINLEMDVVTVLRRLTAIYSGFELDRIEGYKNDKNTAAAVNTTLQAITSRKPLQVIQGAYMLQRIQDIIERSTKGREEPTIVIIDHSLLVDTQERTGSRYDRFTQVSEGLRKMALTYNVILFVLLQQNRAGKSVEDEQPKNSSLKESGSWENDATHICFLWYDPTAKKKKLLLTKNRGGSGGTFTLNYWKKTQVYTEASDNATPTQAADSTAPQKQTRREKQRQKLLNAYSRAIIDTAGRPTLQAMAEAADVTTSTIKSWVKEYGGFMIDGKLIDPAGVDSIVEEQGFIKLTPADNDPFTNPEPGPITGGNGQEITARF